ncbi:MAG: hypothetical protein PHG69_00205 [Candidatus Omnitrophica bacterium]|nr:hypothetical protein [Candidatus Omnitrophota bacterium]
MRIHTEEKRLKDIKSCLKSLPFQFGQNKLQELTRLIYEISKIKNVSPSEILKEAIQGNEFQGAKQAFIHLKGYLLRQRFPESCRDGGNVKFYLPKIDVNPKYIVSRKKSAHFYPKKIFIENDAKDYNLTKEIIKRFPLAEKVLIKRLKDYAISHKIGSTINTYNKRIDNLFLVKERYDFLKPCPCSKGVLGCGYHILNLGFGCKYECSYCFLQNYTNTGGIIIPVNIEDFLSALEKFLKNKKHNVRIGTGEFMDSLALDNLTGFSKILIEFFSKLDNAILELKTKSDNVSGILKLRHNKKTVISWSLNPQPLIESDEWQAQNLKQRLAAARKCSEAGYLVGFHFDPIIYSRRWEGLYRELIDNLFNNINAESIAWISLGTFRFAPKLKTIIEQRFPYSKILDEELILDFDNKLRYPRKQRVEIYKKIYSWIRQYSDSALVYLCMEPKDIWQEVLSRSRF